VIAAGRDFARMQDYIGGRLSGDERRAFEDRLVREPELVRELEDSLRIREGFQQLRAQGYFARAASRGGRFRLWQPALAAAAAAATAGLALFVWGQREMSASPVLMASLESRSAPKVAPLVTAHFTFVSMRGGTIPDLDLPSAGLVEIRAAPATRLSDYRYRVTLSRRDDGDSSKPVAVLGALALSSDGYVHCFADASRLTAGSYQLRIEPDKRAQGMEETFLFNLRAGGSQPAR
jgi:hypothetical protein